MQREARALRAHGFHSRGIAHLLGVHLWMYLRWRRLGLV
jgi:hypothetical protein